MFKRCFLILLFSKNVFPTLLLWLVFKQACLSPRKPMTAVPVQLNESSGNFTRLFSTMFLLEKFSPLSQGTEDKSNTNQMSISIAWFRTFIEGSHARKCAGNGRMSTCYIDYFYNILWRLQWNALRKTQNGDVWSNKQTSMVFNSRRQRSNVHWFDHFGNKAFSSQWWV